MNFVEASQEIRKLYVHLKKTDTEQIITNFCMRKEFSGISYRNMLRILVDCGRKPLKASNVISSAPQVTYACHTKN